MAQGFFSRWDPRLSLLITVTSTRRRGVCVCVWWARMGVCRGMGFGIGVVVRVVVRIEGVVTNEKGIVDDGSE